jgi:hypothetical protein
VSSYFLVWEDGHEKHGSFSLSRAEKAHSQIRHKELSRLVERSTEKCSSGESADFGRMKAQNAVSNSDGSCVKLQSGVVGSLLSALALILRGILRGTRRGTRSQSLYSPPSHHGIHTATFPLPCSQIPCPLTLPLLT